MPAKFQPKDRVGYPGKSSLTRKMLRGTVDDVSEKGYVTIKWNDGTLTCERPTSVFMRKVTKEN
jgi:hypothetical protein